MIPVRQTTMLYQTDPDKKGIPVEAFSFLSKEKPFWDDTQCRVEIIIRDIRLVYQPNKEPKE